jgi:SAM-dependent methyltransferase
VKTKKRDTDKRCLVCEGNDLEKILIMYSRYNPRLFHGVAICRECGHIQLTPLFRHSEYLNINNNFFKDHYMVEEKQNLLNNIKKLKELDEILFPYIHEGIKVLDVGAGEGWAMDYFKRNKCDYYAVEAVPNLAESIRERGGKIIGSTIFDDCPDYEEYFDIIVFRHVIEHLLNPKEALLRLKKLVKTDGVIYLSLPNAALPTNNKGFRVSFLRPVHISYFCIGNLLRLANSVGLTSHFSEEKGLIHCLLKRGSERNLNHNNYYAMQKDAFLAVGRKSFINDYVLISKNLFKDIVRRMF